MLWPVCFTCSPCNLQGLIERERGDSPIKLSLYNSKHVCVCPTVDSQWGRRRGRHVKLIVIYQLTVVKSHRVIIICTLQSLQLWWIMSLSSLSSFCIIFHHRSSWLYSGIVVVSPCVLYCYSKTEHEFTQRCLRPLHTGNFLFRNFLSKVSLARKFFVWTVWFRNKSLSKFCFAIKILFYIMKENFTKFCFTEFCLTFKNKKFPVWKGFTTPTYMYCWQFWLFCDSNKCALHCVDNAERCSQLLINTPQFFLQNRCYYYYVIAIIITIILVISKI